MMWRYIAGASVLVFVVSVARFYHPGLGFTALLGLPEGQITKTPALLAIPHYTYPAWAAYDGQFYVQRAFDPLLRDPIVDRAMDLAPFRARRILFSWTAYLLGLGRPAWIVNVYALQNVACWLVLAMLLARWMPLTSARGFAVWAACLFSHGLLWSVRFSLLDGPSLALIVGAVAAAERGRTLLSAAISGVAALGRETNLLAITAQPWPRDRRAWLRALAAGAIALIPLLVWYDYLRSIYRSTTLVGTDQLVWPGAGLAVSWARTFDGLMSDGLISPFGLQVCVLLSLAAQGLYLLVRPEYREPWWRVGVAYVGLMLLLDQVLADPITGAITRVLLPLTVAFNVLLRREERPPHFWLWFALGNLHVIAATRVMPLMPW
jgi:hypothetical protein